MIDEDKLLVAFTLVELYETFLARWEVDHPGDSDEDVPDFHDFMEYVIHETNKAGALLPRLDEQD